MSSPVLTERALSLRVLVTVFAVWLGSTGAVLWHLDSGNRLRGITCSAPR